MLWLPSLHPAFLLRGQEYLLPLLEADLAHVFALADQGGYERREQVWTVSPADRSTAGRVRGLLQQWRRDGRTVAIDTETTGLDPHTSGLRAIGVAAVGGIEAVSFATSGLPPGLLDGLIADARALAGDEHVTKAFWNFSFDVAVLARHGIPVHGPIFDGIVAHHAINSALPHDLGSVAAEHLLTPAWKEDFRQVEKRGAASVEDMLQYNALDALRTAQLVGPLMQQVHELELGQVVHYQTMWADLARRMEAWGIPIDREVLEKLKTEQKDNVQELLAPIRRDFNWPDFKLTRQVDRQRLLYGILRLPVRRYTPKKLEPSTSYKALLDHLNNPYVLAYTKAYEVDHARRTFVEGYEKHLSSDGRLRVSWNTTGQLGSRWTSRVNVQNIPRPLRRLIAAPPGHVLVYADFAQLEYRIAAVRAGCTQLLKMFADGIDTHAHILTLAFGSQFTSLEPGPKKRVRDVGKRCVYGCQYGAQVAKTYQVLKEDRKIPVEMRAIVTRDFVDRVLRTFYRLAPEYLVWRDRCLDEVNATGHLVVPPLGRRYFFPMLPAEGPLVWNLNVQPVGSDYANLSWLKVDERIRPLGGEFLINGHDSCLALCRESVAEQVKMHVEEAMEWRLDGPAGPVRLYGEAKIGRHFGEIS